MPATGIDFLSFSITKLKFPFHVKRCVNLRDKQYQICLHCKVENQKRLNICFKSVTKNLKPKNKGSSIQVKAIIPKSIYSVPSR